MYRIEFAKFIVTILTPVYDKIVAQHNDDGLLVRLATWRKSIRKRGFGSFQELKEFYEKNVKPIPEQDWRIFDEIVEEK